MQCDVFGRKKNYMKNYNGKKLETIQSLNKIQKKFSTIIREKYYNNLTGE